MKLTDYHASVYLDFAVNVPINQLELLWRYVNELVISEKLRCGLDANAEGAVVLWIATGQITEKRKEILAAIEQWSREAWQTYWTLRPRVEAGEDVELPKKLSPCPYMFKDLLFEEAQ